MSNHDHLQFDYRLLDKKGRIALTVKRGGDIVLVDTLNVLSTKARDRVVTRLCETGPDTQREAVDEKLLSIAAEVQAKAQDTSGSSESSSEVDTSRILRPERFITPEVSGVTVGVYVSGHGKPAGQWRTYLRWSDGKREEREVLESLVLPDKTRLWLMPSPGEPSRQGGGGWALEDRRAWLVGSPPPCPADLFRRLCQVIDYFIEFHGPDARATTAALALWVILTYCYPAWPAVPYLHLGGPKESGKTRVFEALSRLIFRPLQSSNLRAPTMFRTLHERGGTLLYDEAEGLREHNSQIAEINSMLLAGYKHGGRATRLEAVGDTYKTVEFEVFGPKALACIGRLPGALSSRCISIIMFRAPRGSPKPRRHIDEDPNRWRLLRADLHAAALEYGPDFLVMARRPDVCPQMSGRQYELWQPLLALASWIEQCGEEGLLRPMQDFALASIEAAKDNQTPEREEVLLRALAQKVRLGETPTCKDLLSAARAIASAQMFDGWSEKRVSTVMERYRIRTHKSNGRRVFRDVTEDELREIQTAYVVDLGFLDSDGQEEAGQCPDNVPQVPYVPQEPPKSPEDRPEQGT